MIETAVVYGEKAEIGRYALAHCINALAARGSRKFAAGAVFQIPDGRDNLCLYERKKEWKRMAEILPFPLETGEAEAFKCPAVLLPCALVSAEGTGTGDSLTAPAGEPELVVAGWAGLEGMLRIADEEEERLAARFSPSFLRLVKSYSDCIFGSQIPETAGKKKVPVIRHVGAGGIFKALWDLSAEMGMGLEVDLKKIPVRQETIEICELFHINPYQLTSAGCFLMAAEEGSSLAEFLVQNGIEARVIGRMHSGRDKIIRNGEDMRYLDRPAADGIWEIFK